MNEEKIINRKYAYAVDLGTTTIGAAIVEIETGKVLAEKSFKNRQSLYGSDVINRILAASRDKNKLITMKKMVIDDLCKNASEMLIQAGLKNDDIRIVCISGNATMISILLEYDMESMGHAPFNTRLHESIRCMSYDVFEDDFFCGAGLLLTGTASAFIGGDILSGMAYIEKSVIPDKYNKASDIDNVSKSLNWMLLDLGTNGEMVLHTAGKYFATSASCGPAFEGCTRRQHVYGSGTLDAIALGLKTKNILKNGALKPPFDKNGITISKIRLNSDIIRDILLAKAAIRTGIDFLISLAGLSANDIDVVFLAGGFGFYLDLETAYYIGLLPKEFAGKVYVIGNSSLYGAISICRDISLLGFIDDYIVNNKIKVLQLADKKEYQTGLMENMTF